MSTKSLWRSFAGGEIASELHGRIDLTKYNTGLSLCRNFITLPHGPATRRSGFRFIAPARYPARRARLIPFQFSADQTAVLEFGHEYIHIHIDGGTLLESALTVASISGGTVTFTAAHNFATGFVTGDMVFMGGRFYPFTISSSTAIVLRNPDNTSSITSGVTGSIAARVYKVPTTYVEDDLFDIKYAQLADVITLTHPAYPARELGRNGPTSWTLTDVTFAPPTGAPTNVTATPTVATSTNLTQARYVVTAVQPDGVTESLASAPASANNNLTLAGNYNTITWTGVDGCSRYNVYKLRGGVYGYIGQVQPVASASVNIDIASPYNDDGFFKYRRVRVATTAPHGRSTGDRVLVAGTTYFDGLFQITVENTTTFTYAKTTQLKPAATTGTVSTPSLSLTDDNVLADTLSSPPENIIQLNTGAGSYPSTVTHHEQRRWFAGTTEGPQVLWATRTGTNSNLTSSIPSRDADGMELRIAAAQYNQIRHLVPLADMIALTAGGEFRIYADGAPAITPTSVSIKPQGYSGASQVQPVVTSGSVLYVQAQGSRVRELAYNWESNAYRSVDASIMAPHRFNGFTIREMAYSRAPDQILWAVRDDGVLLGLTYVPDQQVFAWHAHDTDGEFESVCVVSEGDQDALYVIVRRLVDSIYVRYLERLNTRMFTQLEDAFFVDAGKTYRGALTNTITGLNHLEGRIVHILADGAVEPPRTVVNGAITLDNAATTVHVGLPITADLRTLPLALEGMQAAGQGTAKNVNAVHLRVSQSSVVKAGPSFTELREYPARAVADPYGSPPALRDGELSLSIDPSWNQDGAVCVRQDLPLPLTVLSMTLEVQTGG